MASQASPRRVSLPADRAKGLSVEQGPQEDLIDSLKNAGNLRVRAANEKIWQKERVFDPQEPATASTNQSAPSFAQNPIRT